MADPLISWNNCCCHCDAEIVWKDVNQTEEVFPLKKEWIFRRYACPQCRKHLIVLRHDECSFGIADEDAIGSLYQCSLDVEPKLSLERCDKTECGSCRFGKADQPATSKRK